MKFKKPKFWDLKKPNWIAYLMLPFTIVLRVNNFILENKKKIKTKNIFTICVGNIYVGGTGKTPTVIKLYQILKKLNIKVMVAKKFYPNHTDEEYILKKKQTLFLKLAEEKFFKKLKIK